MTTITVTCTDQVLSVDARPEIASGGINVDRVQFNFCNKWQDYVKTAVFYRTAEEVYHVLLDETNVAVMPQEVLRTSGLLYIGVFGVRGDVRRTSGLVTYRVDAGAITEATAVPDPTPDIYTQIMARLNELEVQKAPEKLPNPNALTFTGAVEATYDGSEPVTVDIPKIPEVPESGGIAVSGASVGQTIKIAAVDDGGVPTAWEAVDFPSGGGSGSEEYYEIVTTEETTVVSLPTIEWKKNRIKAAVYVRVPSPTDSGNGKGAISFFGKKAVDYYFMSNPSNVHVSSFYILGDLTVLSGLSAYNDAGLQNGVTYYKVNDVRGTKNKPFVTITAPTDRTFPVGTTITATVQFIGGDEA